MKKLFARLMWRLGLKKWYVMTAYGSGRVAIPGYRTEFGALNYVARNLHKSVVIYVDSVHGFIFTKMT